MSAYPQGDAFLTLLLAAMDDAAKEGKLSQLQTQFVPKGGKKLETVRLIVVPEKMQYRWNPEQPLGSPVDQS